MSVKHSFLTRLPLKAAVLTGLCVFLAGCAFFSGEKEEISPENQALLNAVKNPIRYPLEPALAKVKDVNFTDPDTELTPLMFAVLSAETKQMNALLKAGANPDFQNKNGVTALHCAAGMYTAEPMKILLKAGAKADIPDVNGKTPLMEAARLGELGMAKLLVKHQANVNAADSKKRTPLMFAAMAANYSLPVSRWLVEQQGAKDTVDDDSETALLKSIQFGNTETALYLISKVPDAAKDKSAEALLLIAMKQAIGKGNVPVFRGLLKRLPQINATEELAEKYMDRVRVKGFYELTVRKGILPDGKMPLFWAAE